jgi:hypothetical protein
VFDSAIFWVLCFIPGKILIWIFSGGRYVTDLPDDLSKVLVEPVDDLRQHGNKTIVHSDTVVLIGMLFWLGLLIVITVGYWTGKFDLVTPLRIWLFGKIAAVP